MGTRGTGILPVCHVVILAINCDPTSPCTALIHPHRAIVIFNSPQIMPWQNRQTFSGRPRKKRFSGKKSASPGVL